MIVHRVTAALAAATLVSPTAFASAATPSPSSPPSIAPAAVTAQAVRGDDRTSALTIDAAPIPGRNALTVSGRGPASATITVTLVATIGRDLPDVVLQRITTTAAADGSYSTPLALAPRVPARSILTVRATAPGGAAASLRTAPVSPNTETDLDRVPKDL